MIKSPHIKPLQWFFTYVIVILIFSMHVFIPYANATERVHIFYYLWYGNPKINGAYTHWNHEVLPHWDERTNARFLTIGSRFKPPERLHSPFYPYRGPYSSTNRTLIKEHFDEIYKTGASVIVASWSGIASNPLATDTQGVNTDKAVELLLQMAEEYITHDIKICFHLEPYEGRTAEAVNDDIRYIIDRYGKYRSLFRSSDGRPFLYVYDSYHIAPQEWARILKPDGDMTIRGTKYDSVVIGLWLHHEHGQDLVNGGFDGIYTYFATDGFSFGTSSSNWNYMCTFCAQNNLLCILSVAPGYDDSLIRPWNVFSVRDRRNGDYYRNMFTRAISANPDYISITSYNEWGEGTQIEAARSTGSSDARSLYDYSTDDNDDPFKYIKLTKEYVDKYLRHLSADEL